MRYFLMIAVAAAIALSYGEAWASVDCTNTSGVVTCTNLAGTVENWLAGKKNGTSEIIACSWIDDGEDKIYSLEDTVSYSGTGLVKLRLVGNVNGEIIYIEDATIDVDADEGCRFQNFPDVPSEIYGGQGDDWLHGTDHGSFINGESGNDEIHGDVDGDQLYGGSENDDIWGGGGVDYLYGQTGADELHGEDGNDYLYAGGNDDVRDYLWCDDIDEIVYTSNYADGGEYCNYWPCTLTNTYCYYCDDCYLCVDRTGDCS